MSNKSREVIWGGRIMGAKIRAEGAREEARKAVRAADRAETDGFHVRQLHLGHAKPAHFLASGMPSRLLHALDQFPCKLAHVPIAAFRQPPVSGYS
jgi:hypothetical protein